jgi:hypothetical protein
MVLSLLLLGGIEENMGSVFPYNSRIPILIPLELKFRTIPVYLPLRV